MPYGHDLSNMATDVYITMTSRRDYAPRLHDIEQNLLKRADAGTFDPTKAARLYSYAIDHFAKMYAGESRYAGKWFHFITPADRHQVACAYASDFETEHQDRITEGQK